MSLKVTLVVLSLFGWLGESISEPICGEDDPRVQRGSMSYEFMVEKYGRDPECDV